MATNLSDCIWIQRQQCPCGDWKCFIKYEGYEHGQATQSTNHGTSSPSSLDIVFAPYVGQMFKTDDEAFEFYSSFARRNGFSIRKARSTESHNLGVYRRDFVCYRSGFNQPRKKANAEHPRDRKSVRCGCDAKLYLTKEIVDGVTQWYVSQFSNVHNHELLKDDQVRLLPAYRKIQEADQERILLLSKAGFPVNRIIQKLELEKGVQPGQLPFIEKDIRNFIRTCKKTVQENDCVLTEKREADMVELLQACKAMGERDGDFAFDLTTNANGKVENIAWSYGDSVRAFTLFSDVVQFDISYQSITYGMLLCILSGIDNYGKSVFFSCALLQEESSRAFAWALQTFVRFMGGRHPQTIVTDLDSGLRDAIFCRSVMLLVRDIAKEEIRCIPLRTCMPIEEHARSIVTPYVFNVLQHELVLSTQYTTTEMANGSFVVRHYKKVEAECLVIWMPEEEQIHCSCKGYERSGILCRHALRLLVTKNYFQVPDKYLPLRWRLESSLVPMDDGGVQTVEEECYQSVHSLTDALLAESLMSKERFSYVRRQLATLLDHVRSIPVDEVAQEVATNNSSES